MVRTWLCLIERRAQGREPLVLHQHQEMRLRQIGRRGGVEPGRPVLDGIEPVAGQRLAGGSAMRGIGSGVSPFTG